MKGTYYAGRVLKLGTLDQEMLVSALNRPEAVFYRGNAWTFIDVEEVKTSNYHYIFGRLSKYAPEGEVGIVDVQSRSVKQQVEPNLLVASSPFIYIPEHSGIAFLNVSGQITPKHFVRRFSEIVKHTHANFFVECDIELVTDLKSFAAKLVALDGIFRIEARISPPNPLFSPLWESLEKYLRKRNTDRMAIIEDAPESDTLRTSLPELVEEVSLQTEDSQYIPDESIPIGDAAILMAADGYGHGTIRGRKDDDIVVIKTSETALNFSFDKIPDPYEFYLKVLNLFRKIKEKRHMEHGD